MSRVEEEVSKPIRVPTGIQQVLRDGRTKRANA